MSLDRIWIGVAAIALAGIIALQSHRLGDSPAYLNLDETHFGNHAYSLATGGRDLNGNVLPLFISLEDPLGDRTPLPWGSTWYHPYGFYLIASALTVMPLDEAAIRLPIAMTGVLGIVLMFLVARRWYNNRTAGLIAGALLAMTPAHFILSRLAMDYLLPLPFTLGWLLALQRLRERRTRSAALIVGLVLGLGCYSFVSSWMLMPLFLALSVATAMFDMRARGLVPTMIAGFGVAMLPLAAWVAWHPEMPGNIVAQYRVGGTSPSIQAVIGAYWSYFNPSFLFVNGGSSRLVSTGQIGVWPIGVGVLLLISVMRVIARQPMPLARVLIAGLLIAPLPAALKGEPFAIQRAVTMLPFGVLLSTGAAISLVARRPVLAIAVVVACLSVPYQFSGFLSDYFGNYRIRSATTLDPTSFREIAASLVDADADVIAIPAPLYDISAKWRFYATKLGRPDLLQRTRYYSGDVSELGELPSRAVVVVESSRLPASGDWKVVAAPADVTGQTPLQLIRH